jgi:hypothetical protein
MVGSVVLSRDFDFRSAATGGEDLDTCSHMYTAEPPKRMREANSLNPQDGSLGTIADPDWPCRGV